MSATLNQSQADLLRMLGNFLVAILGANVSIVIGQANRVAEPKVPDFVVMTPIRRQRLSTNVDSYADVQFTGAIAGNILTVSAVQFGALAISATLFGAGIVNGTTIASQSSGSPGKVGTYVLSGNPQTVSAETMAAGVNAALQPTQVTVQLDVHGPNGADNAQKISTLLRDNYAVQQFEEQDNAVDVTPLYAEDPRQVPFVNDQNQVEDRWIVEAQLQANQVATVPLQFATAAAVELISVEERYAA